MKLVTLTGHLSKRFGDETAIRMIKKAKEIEKDLEDSKILITEDELKNPRFLYDIIQSIVYIIFGIIIMWFAIKGVKLDPNMVFSLITLSFATMFIILGSKGFYYEISAQISLKNNTYYFRTDKVDKKIIKETNNGNKYYLYFREVNEKIQTSHFQYETSSIGEECYIAFIGKKRKAFNKEYYEVEDKSKVR